MKEFTIELFKTGKYEVFTRGGRPVRILATDIKSNKPVCGALYYGVLKSESVYTWSARGKWNDMNTNDDSKNDLMLKGRMPEYYIIHYKNEHGLILTHVCMDKAELERMEQHLQETEGYVYLSTTTHTYEE